MSDLVSARTYCNSVFDGTHDTPKPVEKGKLLITSKHIVGKTLNTSTAYMISQEDYNFVQKRSSVSQWDILFSMIGSVGEVYLEKDKETDYAIKNIGVFSCKDESKAKWLYYYFQSPASKQYVKRYLNGAVQKFLPLGALRDFPIIPFSNEKKAIITVLESLDKKIELNNRINTELEAMVKTLYDYWFVQFDFPFDFETGKSSEQGKPYKSSGGKMVFNEALKRDIPEGWEVDTISHIIEVKDGTHDSPKPKETGYHLITSKNLKKEGLDFENANLISEEDYENINKRSEVETGDILFSMIGSIGTVYKVDEKKINFAIKNVALYKTSQKPNYKNYLYTTLNSHYMKQYMGNVISGSIQKFIGLGALRKMPVLNNATIINSFEKKTEHLFQKMSLIREENQQLTQLRDWLLPMLMNGQVTVK